jgi:hypothetical protein
VVDFGVNQAGVCKLSNIMLAKGANVTMKHAEIMQHALLPDVYGARFPIEIYTRGCHWFPCMLASSEQACDQ